MAASDDARYLKLLLDPLVQCASYRPAFGQDGDEGIDLPQFRSLYGGDPLYHWIGLDSDLMYAAHKAAGGMTSIYRQLGIGCERLLRRIIQDKLGLSDQQVAWSYVYDETKVHTLDARIVAADITDRAARARFVSWTRASALNLGVSAASADGLVGAAFEIRQGYKSADSKRQNADIRFGNRAYLDVNLLPVIAIVSTQASDVVCRKYRERRLLVLRGHLEGDASTSTFAFYRDVIGYDLADFFKRNSNVIRREFESMIKTLLDPKT